MNQPRTLCLTSVTKLCFEDLRGLIVFFVSGMRGLILLSAVAGSAFGTIREVGLGQSFGTIGSAISLASAGDTINVHAGTYNEAVLTVSKNNLTIQANSGDTPVLVGRISIGSTPGVTINGLTITGWASSTAGNYGIYQSGGSGLTVSNCNINNGWGTGIYSRNSTSLVISGNTIWANKNTAAADGTSIVIISGHSSSASYTTGVKILNNIVHDHETDGMQIHGQYFTVAGNNVYNNITTNWANTHPDGIQFIAASADGFTDTQHILVFNNIFRNQTQNIFVEGQTPGDGSAVTDIQIWNNVCYCDTGLINGVNMDSLGNKGMMIKYVKDCIIVNNDIGRNGNTAIYMQLCGTGGIVFKNNIVQNSLSYGVYNDTPVCVSAGNMDNNQYNCSNDPIVWGSSFYSSRIAFRASVPTQEASGRDGNPMLTSWVTPSLMLGSPCIDNGVTLAAAYATDAAGNPRPNPSGAQLKWDIGAYEYGSVVLPNNVAIAFVP